MNEHDRHSLSQEFREIEALCGNQSITVQSLLNQIQGRGEALLTLFLAGPFLLPIPLPGLSIPFGILIAMFALSLCTGWKPWLPKAWMARPIPDELVLKFCQTSTRFLKKVERWIRPRWLWIHRSRVFKSSAGIMILVCGLLLAMPLPPGTNAPPAMAIVCLSIALLEGDGLLLVLGYGLFVLNLSFFTLLSVLGYEAIMKIIGLSF